MRELTSHRVGGLNEGLKVLVLDEPGPGGANHSYQITTGNKPLRQMLASPHPCDVEFQRGPIAEVGVNGISNEALLAIVEDRLKGFQSGSFSCRENALALTHVQDALHWLHHRTRDRVARDVEGRSQP